MEWVKKMLQDSLPEYPEPHYWLLLVHLGLKTCLCSLYLSSGCKHAIINYLGHCILVFYLRVLCVGLCYSLGLPICLFLHPELLSARILGSRIPDICQQNSGHFWWRPKFFWECLYIFKKSLICLCIWGVCDLNIA